MKVDGKTMQSLRAEVVSRLVIGNGIITTGSAQPATSEDVIHADPAKTNMEKNISGTHIHLPPYYKSVIILQDRFSFVDISIGSGPSIDDYRSSPTAYSYSTERNVVVDSSAIYLINSNSDQTITLPKYTVMLKFSFYYLGVMLLLGCTNNVNKPKDITIPVEEVRLEVNYQKIIDSLGAGKLYNETKWLMYCIHCDVLPEWRKAYSHLPKRPCAFLDLKLMGVEKKDSIIKI